MSKISELVTIPTVDVTNDVLPIVDTSDSTTKKVTPLSLMENKILKQPVSVTTDGNGNFSIDLTPYVGSNINKLINVMPRTANRPFSFYINETTLYGRAFLSDFVTPAGNVSVDAMLFIDVLP